MKHKFILANSTIVYLVLLATLASCVDTTTADRRKKRTDPSNDVVVIDNKPVINKPIYAAQKAQAKARAEGMRVLATAFEAGEIKTLYDASAKYQAIDKQSRIAFDRALSEALQKKLANPDTDDLPVNSATIFRAIADELDQAAK